MQSRLISPARHFACFQDVSRPCPHFVSLMAFTLSIFAFITGFCSWQLSLSRTRPESGTSTLGERALLHTAAAIVAGAYHCEASHGVAAVLRPSADKPYVLLPTSKTRPVAVRGARAFLLGRALKGSSGAVRFLIGFLCCCRTLAFCFRHGGAGVSFYYNVNIRSGF
jgi:hypothetical protein